MEIGQPEAKLVMHCLVRDEEVDGLLRDGG